jgi:hypothetical protein
MKKILELISTCNNSKPITYAREFNQINEALQEELCSIFEDNVMSNEFYTVYNDIMVLCYLPDFLPIIILSITKSPGEYEVVKSGIFTINYTEYLSNELNDDQDVDIVITSILQEIENKVIALLKNI